jgi:hypothetical protein
MAFHVMPTSSAPFAVLVRTLSRLRNKLNLCIQKSIESYWLSMLFFVYSLLFNVGNSLIDATLAGCIDFLIGSVGYGMREEF